MDEHMGHHDHHRMGEEKPETAPNEHEMPVAKMDHSMEADGQADDNGQMEHTSNAEHTSHAKHASPADHPNHKGHTEQLEHTEHKGHTGHVDHSGHEQMFRQRFWVSLLLSIPVLIFSPSIQEWLDYSLPAFSGGQWIAPGFSRVIV